MIQHMISLIDIGKIHTTSKQKDTQLEVAFQTYALSVQLVIQMRVQHYDMYRCNHK